LPAGTIIIGAVGIAEGGMIGTAVALDTPGENSCEVCAEIGRLVAQDNPKHSTAQAPCSNHAADVARISAAMPGAVLDLNRGEFKPIAPVCDLRIAMLGAFRHACWN
jgi:hypothetical protein